MKVIFYLENKEKPVKTAETPDNSLPYTGETVVLRDGVYRISDVNVDAQDESTNVAKIDITSKADLA